MSELQIPDDVIQSARVRANFMPIGGELLQSCIRHISRAIMAERERCARIAEEHAKTNSMAREVAAAIRGDSNEARNAR